MQNIKLPINWTPGHSDFFSLFFFKTLYKTIESICPNSWVFFSITMTLDRTHCLYVTGSYIWWRYMYVPDLTPSVFPLIPPLQLITQIHMTHPQIPLYISATRRRYYNRFGLAVMKVSIFRVYSATFPLLSHSEWPLCWRRVLQWKKVLRRCLTCLPLCPALLSLVPCCLTCRTAPAQRSTPWLRHCCPCQQHFTG